MKHPFFGNGRRDISALQAFRLAASSGGGCAVAGAAAGFGEVGTSGAAAVARLEESAGSRLANSASERIADFCNIDITPFP